MAEAGGGNRVGRIGRGLVGLLGIGDNTTGHSEKLISGVGAALGMVLVFTISRWYLGPHSSALVVASMGATAVLLFAVPHGALSQPWALLAGHLLSAFIGVTCQRWLPDWSWTPALAVALAVAAMYYLRCIHPPGGATALTAVIGSHEIHALGYQYLLTPVLLNVLSMLAVAVLFNGLFRWRRYPVVLSRRTPAAKAEAAQAPGAGLSHEDLAAAMEQINSYIDVTSEELAQLFDLAVQHAVQHQEHPQVLLIGGHYSNGRFGEQWAVRQIIDAPDNLESERSKLIFKTVAGADSYETGVCTLREFRQWASFPVVFSGGRWVRSHRPEAA